MGERFVVYGANGYTGKLVAAVAKAHGLDPLLSGRSGDKLLNVASALGFDARTAHIEDRASLDRLLADAAIIINLAGPFSATAGPMIEACLRGRVPYVDVTVEGPVIEASAARGSDAARAGVVIMSGCGFDVVAADCLASYVAWRLPDAEEVTLAVSAAGGSSRGTQKTLIESLGRGSEIRRKGHSFVLRRLPESVIDFGAGPTPVVALGSGDVAAAYLSTGIPNIEVFRDPAPSIRRLIRLRRRLGRFYDLPLVQRRLKKGVDRRVEGPTPAEREAAGTRIVAEARAQDGRRAMTRLAAPNSYTLTALTVVDIARRIVQGEVDPGFSTPSQAFGPDYILGFPGVSRWDLE